MVIRPGHIWLTGFSGSGKSTIAPLLAQRLGLASHDLDAIIEVELATPIGDIFVSDGEERFREAESRIIRELSSRRSPAVIALGGGVLEIPGNRTVIRRNGTLVYLRCAQSELYRRLRRLNDRPLLHGHHGQAVSARILKDRIARLLAQRRSAYEQADLIVSTTQHSPAEVAAVIAGKLRGLYA